MFATRLIWQSHPSLLHGGLLIVLATAWLLVIGRRLKHRHPKRLSRLLLVPKVLLALLLLLLFFDPAWVLIEQVTPELRFLTAIDDSTSMEVKDRNGLSRLARAETIAGQLEYRLPNIAFDRAYFSDRLALPPNQTRSPEPDPRRTDLAQVLMDIELQSAIGMYDGAILLTDGGDERFDPFRMPAIPHYIVAVGNQPGMQNDIAIHAVEVPVFAEPGADIDCTISLRGHGNAAFLRQLDRARIDLQELTADGATWMSVGQKIIDLHKGAAEITMTIAGTDDQQERDFRIWVDPVEDELTHLNNERRFSVLVEPRHWRVLLYARRLGHNVAELRRMLASQPDMTLTSLIRLRDELFAGQPGRLEHEVRLESFPESADALHAFHCLIIGSFPAAEWSDRQMQALVDFVAGGGAVIFLGGEDSFGRGGYADSPLHSLFPWVLRNNEPETVIAALEVGPAPAATQPGMMPGWADTMRQAQPLTLYSINRPGRLRPGAVALLNASYEGEHVPVIALQPYGRGRVMGVATDTIWRWRTAGREARSAYDHFWSNGIRFLAAREQGGSFMRVHFDRDNYHPGERAEIRVQVPGQHPGDQVRVLLEKRFDNEVKIVPLERRPGAAPAFHGHPLFTKRGSHTFVFTARIDNQTVETFTRQMWIGSRLNEGANIYVDHGFLNKLAARGGQSVAAENDIEPLVTRLKAHLVQTRQRRIVPLVQFRGVYLILIVIVMAGEWILRRRLNLL